jgi:predicted Zn-dependent protease
MLHRAIVLGLFLAGLLPAGGTRAQVPLMAPKEIVIYVHEDLPDTDFVDPLVCELSRVLAVPVRTERSSMPIDLGVMASMSELDAAKVLDRLYLATGPFKQAFMYIIVPHGLRSNGGRVFGTNFGPPYNKGVVSIADLVPVGPGVTPQQATDRTFRRTYKIILRYIAQAAGLWAKTGCVMAMPRGLGELDGKPSEFCEDDRASLVAAGVLKPEPGNGVCGPVAMIDR